MNPTVRIKLFSRSHLNNRKSWTKLVLAALVAIAILLGAGYIYHLLQTRLEAERFGEAGPAIPLSELPYRIASWEGKDVPISETALAVADNDDYLSRSYVDPARRIQATIYIGYTSEPRRMLGHRPRVCYVGSGWVHDGTIERTLTSSNGLAIPCLVHRFHKPGLDYREIVVLNFYILNGEITSDHKQFSGLRWRRPRTSRSSGDYVAQVQVSSSSEVVAEAATLEFTEAILEHF